MKSAMAVRLLPREVVVMWLGARCYREPRFSRCWKKEWMLRVVAAGLKPDEIMPRWTTLDVQAAGCLFRLALFSSPLDWNIQMFTTRSN